jgi:hydroxymethylpyrimidine kinase/phosphomethylpyrimidine kinase
MKAPARLPCVLSIGGLDPGGGAGLLADARGILAAGAFPCAVAAVLTVQSTSGLVSTHDIEPARVSAQARAVLAHQRVRAIKTGALGSLGNIRAVAAIADAHRHVPLVVDPVLLPSRGKGRLLAASATQALARYLVLRATLVTANVPEAEALLGVRITTLSEAHDAALALVAMGAGAALVKGGHMSGRDAIDASWPR